MKNFLFLFLLFSFYFSFSQVIPLQKNGKWGLQRWEKHYIPIMDKDGNDVDEKIQYKKNACCFDYEAVQAWDSHTGCLKKGDKWAIYKESDDSIQISAAIFTAPSQPKIKHDIYNSYFFTKEKGKYGLISPDLNLICLPKYDSIGFFGVWTYGSVQPPISKEWYLARGNYALVKNKKKLGVIDWEGKEILPCDYEDIQIWATFQEAPTFALYKNKKAALFRKSLQSEFIYEEIMEQYPYFKVKKDPFYGLLDTLGREILPCRYSSLVVLSDSFFQVKTAEGWGVKNVKGESVLACQYTELAPDLQYHSLEGFVTRKGKTVQHWSKEGKPVSMKKNKENEEESEQSTRYGAFDILRIGQNFGVKELGSTEWLLQPQFEKIVGVAKGFWAKKQGKWERYNENGEVLIQYDGVHYPNNTQLGICMVKQNGKNGLYDCYAEKEILPCKYTHLQFFDDNDAGIHYLYEGNDLFGIITFQTVEDTAIISPCIFEDVQSVQMRDILKAFTPDGSIFVSTGDKITIPNLMKVQIGGKWKIWDLVKQNYIPSESAEFVTDHNYSSEVICAILREEKGFFFLDYEQQAKANLSPFWEDYKVISETLIWVKKAGQWQVWDAEKRGIEEKYGLYDEIEEKGRNFLVTKKGKYGLLSNSLQYMIPCNQNTLTVTCISESLLEVYMGTEKIYVYEGEVVK